MTQVSPYMIRAARSADAAQVADLLAELGYPTTTGDAQHRLARLLARDDAGVLVADAAGEVIGVAAYQLLELLERAQPQCRLTALVVRADTRRLGVARALVADVEALACAHGCFRVEVTTRASREDALDFYTAAGFTVRPHRLVKVLDR
jgi:ribosomal protein S18 acetylase RimI-like enzyme